MFRGKVRKDLVVKHRRLDNDALSGRNIVIVGGTSGLGYAIATAALAKGANVRIVGRTFRGEARPGLSFIPADLSLMKNADALADALDAPSIDILLFTNGIMAGSTRDVTPEGIERDLAVSYLSRHVLWRRIAPQLGSARAAATGKPRVFVMGFPGQGQAGNVDDFNSEGSYSLMTAHSNTVVGNEALVLDAITRFPKLDVFGLNPGLVKTNIRAAIVGEGTWMQRIVEGLISLMFPDAETYAARILPLLAAPELEGRSGAMFNSRAEAIEASAPLLAAGFVPRVISATEALAERALGKR